MGASSPHARRTHAMRAVATSSVATCYVLPLSMLPYERRHRPESQSFRMYETKVSQSENTWLKAQFSVLNVFQVKTLWSTRSRFWISYWKSQIQRGMVFVYKMANVEDAVCLLASEIIREDEEIGPVSDRKHVQDWKLRIINEYQSPVTVKALHICSYEW